MRLRSILVSTVLICVLADAAHAKLRAEALDRSLELGRRFLLNCQRPDGSLIYEIDAVSGNDLGTRYATREMGGLWALAVFHRHSPTKETADAILKSFTFYGGQARRTAGGGRYLCEPTAKEGATNTVALHALAMMDFLAADYQLDPEIRKLHEQNLADTIKFLLSLRRPGGMFFSTYRGADGRGAEKPSPYSDGQSLLVLARVAKQEGNEAIRDIAIESAAAMYNTYVRDALRENPNSEDTGGFYQWGSMAFYELYTSGWAGTQPYAARTIAMARWMTDIRKVADRGMNTGYAYEGLAVAWELARLTNDRKSQQYLGAMIEKGMSNLLTGQIGMGSKSAAIPSTFLKSEKVRGGVVSKEADPRLRIDVTQHQMHATLLLRALMFSPDEAAK